MTRVQMRLSILAGVSAIALVVVLAIRPKEQRSVNSSNNASKSVSSGTASSDQPLSSSRPKNPVSAKQQYSQMMESLQRDQARINELAQEEMALAGPFNAERQKIEEIAKENANTSTVRLKVISPVLRLRGDADKIRSIDIEIVRLLDEQMSIVIKKEELLHYSGADFDQDAQGREAILTFKAQINQSAAACEGFLRSTNGFAEALAQ